MNNHLDRNKILLAICLACSVLALLLSGLIEGVPYAPFRKVETFTEDLRARMGRKAGVDPRLVLIGIDRPIYEATDFSEADLQSAPILSELQKNFPWNRTVWAELIERLAAAGAKVVAFDLVFGSQNPGDEALADALARHKDKVVIGCTMSTQKTDRGDFLHLISPNQVVLPAADSDALVQDDRVGYVNIPKDFDGIVRRARYRQTGAQAGFVVDGAVVMESLAARSLRKFGLTANIPPAFETARFRYGNPPGSGYKIHPIGDVLTPKLWEKNYGNGAFFKDKIVLVGPTAGIFHDEHDTPFTQRQMNGPEVHLNIMAAGLQKEFLKETPTAWSLLIILATGMLAVVLSSHKLHPAGRLAALIFSVAVYWVLAQWLYDGPGWVVPVAVPLIALLVGGILILFYDFFKERLDKVKLRHTMGLYFSPTVLEAVLADPGSMEPKNADVTLLLTDIRNFTPLAEMLGPQGMFELLNKAFEAQTNAIMLEEGNLEHFLGDQFLSYWGAPKAQPDAADRSLKAARALIIAMEAMRETLSQPVNELFGYGVALHSGRVLVGNKGSAQRLDYGLVGDPVNASSRIEALTKYYGVKLLLSRDTFVQLTDPGCHRLIDRTIVKGKSEPIELLECENHCTPPEYAKLCAEYASAYELYAAGHFTEAKALFDGMVARFSDGASRTLGQRCAQLAAEPPPDWKGIWKMDSK